jgi:L-fuconolactonase
MSMIDSHHHVWDPSHRRHAWLEELPNVNKAFSLDDLRPMAAAADVSGTVLVQVLNDLDESAEFLALAATDPLVRGVVGWVDLTGAEVAESLASLVAGPGGEHLVGIRHLVQNEPDREWLLRPDVRQGIAMVGAAGLVYDLLVLPHHLGVAQKLVRGLPEVRFVVDHMAKPRIAVGEIDDWARDMRLLADLPNVACKVSGILTEAGEDWSPSALQPYVQVVVEAFGPSRLMIGSDWPVSLLATDYERVLVTLRDTLSATGLDGADLQHVLHGTAEDWYALP